MNNFVKIMVLAVILTSNIANADQCWAVSKEQHQNWEYLFAKLKPGDVLISLCEPCNMKKPERIDVYTVEGTSINGKSLDAAYVFIAEDPSATGERKFLNVAKLIGCPAEGVSASITVDPSTLDESSEAPKPVEKKEDSGDSDSLDSLFGE